MERGAKNQQTVVGGGGVLVPVVVVAGGGSVARSQSQSHRPSSLRDRRQTRMMSPGKTGMVGRWASWVSTCTPNMAMVVCQDPFQ